MTRQKNSASISEHVSRTDIVAERGVHSVSKWSTVCAVFFFLVCGTVHATDAGVKTAAPAAVPAGVLLDKRLAVIDVQRVLQESLAARSVQKQLETQRAKFQNEISGREKQLNDADNELKELRNTGNGDALAEREQQLRQKFMEMERDVQTKRHALDEGFSAAMGVVRNNLLEVVERLARGRGIQAVLLKQQALWYDNALDMTDDVLQKLNAQLVDVPVKMDTPPVADKSIHEADDVPLVTPKPKPAPNKSKN
jgi:outer membrane protein